MKLAYTAIIVFFIATIIALSVNLANAQWSAINSGYAVTTNYHGKIVFPGTLVTATAGTTDKNVTHVTFLWKYPNETTAYTTANVPVWSNDSTWDGKLIYYANSSYTPTIEGDWGVQAFFIGDGGKTKAGINCTIMIRATSFNVVPDFPVVGSIGALVTMLVGVGLFWHKKKK
ncbi:MAG: hypothetical protein QXE76_06240 [Candidatus Bathyarchaeia archaeon]